MIRDLATGSHHVKQSNLGPWPDVATARSFLAFLAGYSSDTDVFSRNLAGEQQVADWLIEHGLGPLAYARCLEPYPVLANHLQHDIFSSVAENSLHWQNLEQISAQFSRESIPFVLLKGAALAETVYGSRERRTMSDVDLWLKKCDIAPSCTLMVDLGFQSRGKEDRPLDLQMMSDGEIQFYHHDRPQTLVELHLSPFPGWWLKRTTAINNEEIWSRIEPLKGWEYGFHLSPEDTVIHVAVHLAVNHQFGLSVVRSLMDIVLTAEVRTVDWTIVASRARQWRVATAVWLVLSLLQQLVGTSGLDKSLQQLQPSYWRRRYLLQLVSPESILLGADLSSGRIRLLYLLLLVDRVRDMARLIFRTLWPEQEWLRARYGVPYTHRRHLGRIIRHGQI
jgi:hypothetical protein